MSEELSKEQKVLLALYRLCHEGRRRVRYEDIVVRVFKDYPGDFHLKGYTEYPDTGDAVHKPLYDYRKRGMVSASNKMFSLTAHGMAEAERLQAVEKGRPVVAQNRHRLERDAQIEIERVKQLEGFKLFLEGRRDQIIDSDLFEYLGVSVRSNRNDFIGRIEAMKSAIAAVARAGLNDSSLAGVSEFHEFLMEQFASVMASKTGKAGSADKGG